MTPRPGAARPSRSASRSPRDLVAAGNRCLITGDMGIANTTASAALIAAFTGARRRRRSPAAAPASTTPPTPARSRSSAPRSPAHEPDAGTDPLERARRRSAASSTPRIAGFVLGAAAARVPVVLDGVIAGAAALVAAALAPAVRDACVAGHRSAEPGHAAALDHLGLRPLVDLDLRLGEGTGALLALPLVQSAVRVLHEVATFDSAGVADKA